MANSPEFSIIQVVTASPGKKNPSQSPYSFLRAKGLHNEQLERIVIKMPVIPRIAQIKRNKGKIVIMFIHYF